jgi:hypothetical protein
MQRAAVVVPEVEEGLAGRKGAGKRLPLLLLWRGDKGLR